MFRIEWRRGGLEIKAERLLKGSSNKFRKEMWKAQIQVVEWGGKKRSYSLCILQPDRLNAKEREKSRLTSKFLTWATGKMEWQLTGIGRITGKQGGTVLGSLGVWFRPVNKSKWWFPCCTEIAADRVVYSEVFMLFVTSLAHVKWQFLLVIFLWERNEDYPKFHFLSCSYSLKRNVFFMFSLKFVWWIFFFFLQLLLWQMEVPRLGIELELLLPACATAVPDP